MIEAKKGAFNKFEELGNRIAERMFAVVDGIPEAGKPFDTVSMTPDEQLRNYLSLRNDVAAWTELIKQHGLKPVLEYGIEMEKAMQRSLKDAESY